MSPRRTAVPPRGCRHHGSGCGGARREVTYDAGQHSPRRQWHRVQRRWSPGSVSQYATKAGPRLLIKYSAEREDGTKRDVLKRGFRTRKDAAAALRADIRESEPGEWVEPSERPLDAYLAEWIQEQRLSTEGGAVIRRAEGHG